MIRTALHKHLKLRLMCHNISRYHFAQESEEKEVCPPQQTADDQLQAKKANDVYYLLKKFHTRESEAPLEPAGRKPTMIKKPRAEAFFKCLEKGGSLREATKLLRMEVLPKPPELSEEEKAKISPISPTSVQVLFRDYIYNVQNQRRKMRRALQQAKPGAFRRDTIILRFQDELTSIQRLQNPNLFTYIEKKTRNFDMSLNEMFEETKKFDAEFCWEKFERFFSNNIYRFLKDEQFTEVMFQQPTFRGYIEKLPLKFFKTYSRAVTDDNIYQILRNCKSGFTAQSPLLRYVRTNRKGSFFKDQASFEKFLDQMAKDKQDTLLYQYFVFNENVSPFLNYAYFIRGLLNLSWGGSQNEVQLQKQLKHLLLMKFKLSLNKELQLYFADLFFGAESYEKGILSIVLNLLILQRLANQESTSDLFEAFKSTLGHERYQFYLENELPNLLKSMNIKQYHLNYLKSLNYNSQAVRSKPLLCVTNLDYIFQKTNQICSGSSQITYQPTHYNLFTEETFLNKLTPQYQLQDALINNNYNYVKKSLTDIMGFKNYSRAAERYAQKKIYKQDLQRLNFLKYNSTPEMAFRQQQKREQNAEKLQFKNQAREYFKEITRKSLKLVQSKYPDLKITRPPLAGKFPLRLKTWMISRILKHPNLQAPAEALYLLKKFKPLMRARLAGAKGLDLTRDERLQQRKNLLIFRKIKQKFRRSKLFQLFLRRQEAKEEQIANYHLKNYSSFQDKKNQKLKDSLLNYVDRQEDEKFRRIRKAFGKNYHLFIDYRSDDYHKLIRVNSKIKKQQMTLTKNKFEDKKKEVLDKLNQLKMKQQTVSGQTPKFAFSSSIKEIFVDVELAKESLKEKGDGLGRYLGINKLIDAAVEQEEQQQLFIKKVKKGEVHKETRSLNLNETQTLKQIFSLDREKPQQQILERIQKIADRQPNDLFKKVERTPFVSNRQYQQEKTQTQELVAPQKDKEFQFELTVPDVQLSNYDFTQKAKFQIEQFFKQEKPKDQLVQEIQTFFAGIQANQNNYHLYLISELIKALETNMPDDSLLIFAQIICQVKDQIALDEKIRVKYSTQYGDIEKNYGKYIGQTCTPFSLGSKGYNYLLEFILKDNNYNRLVYKRIMSHYSLYETVLYDSVFQKISEITINNKIPQTCAEIIYAFQFKKISINTTQMRRIASLLYQFKHFEAETEQLIISFYHTYQWDLKFSDLKPIIQRLMSLRKRDRYMSLYESLKDQILARKLRQTPTDPVELTKVMTEFKQKQKDQLQQFVRSFATLLLESQLIEEARLVINDSKRIRYQFQVEDYNLWLYSHVNHFEDALKIFHDFENKFPGVYDAKLLSTLCFVIQQQKSVSESDDTKTMFSEVIKRYILEKNLPLTAELVFDISNTFNKLKEFTNFSNFMKFLLETRYPVIYAHKSLFYKVMNNADQDSIKGLIKSIIDVLFKDEITKKKEQRNRSSNSDEPKQYEIGSSQKDNPLHIKELAQVKQIKKVKVGKRTRLRGGKSKFNQIETDSVQEKQPEEETKSGKE